MQAVHTQAPAALKGRVVEVEITAVQPNSLSGTIVEDAPASRRPVREACA